MLILPAIDIRGGKCVRLIQGDYAQETVYGDDPVAVALNFVRQGAEWIHVVDLDGAKTGAPQNLGVAERIAKESGVKVELGGGIRDLETAQRVLAAGITRVIFGTRLVSDRSRSEKLFKALGDRAVAGIDARNGKVSVVGWTEDSDLDALDFARELQAVGAKTFIVTDIATDGMLQGPNTEMLGLFAKNLSAGIVASGGVSSLADLQAIKQLGGTIQGAIVGKAIYENRFTVNEAIEAVL